LLTPPAQIAASSPGRICPAIQRQLPAIKKEGQGYGGKLEAKPESHRQHKPFRGQKVLIQRYVSLEKKWKEIYSDKSSLFCVSLLPYSVCVSFLPYLVPFLFGRQV
jgi:hypothetical protein